MIKGPVINKELIIANDAMNGDIIQAIHNLYPVALIQTKDYANRFKANSAKEAAKNVWDFLKAKIKYKRDPNEKQMIRLPNRFINMGNGDCKSYALFSCAVLANLGYQVAFRYASYKKDNSTPTHVYCIVYDENGNEIICDGVFRFFNKEKKYCSKKDYRMQVVALADNVNSDANIMRKRLTSMNIHNRKRLLRALKKRKKLKEQLVRKAGLFDNDLGYVGAIAGKKKKKKGKFFKKIGKNIKKVVSASNKLALIPMRKSFLLLVNLNVRGIAKKLSLALKQKPGKVEKLWKQLGGNASVLKRAINTGAKKKPLLGAKKSLRGVEGIGAAPAAAVLAAAGTILAAFASILKSVKGEPETKEDIQADQELNQTLDQAASSSNKEILNEVMTSGSSGSSSSAIEDSGSSENSDSEGEGGLDKKLILPIAIGLGLLIFNKK
jgi:hypothetical protein